MIKDQRFFEREITHLRHEINHGPFESRKTSILTRFGRLSEKIARSSADAAERARSSPNSDLTSGLPLCEYAREILSAIQTNPVTIICGETGSGKTTQIPKLCLQLNRGVRAWIGHTQPRRIAARSVAQRLAEELGSRMGDDVGYVVRFDANLSEKTRIKVMTDGVLLTEIKRDHLLYHYDTLIIDEAHEHSLNMDLLFGHLRQILPQRPDLKLIIASATLDPEKLSTYFSGAPVIDIPGRSYPVEVRYLIEDGNPSAVGERDLSAQVHETAKNLLGEVSGDVLVFLPGERDIRDSAGRLKGDKGLSIEVLPLYARLNSAQQQRIFKPGRERRVILATNVAETSLTVPNIHAVIDTGLARISRYSPRTKLQRLPVEFISQASANQRRGRCGRVAPGICVRLYTRAQFDAFRTHDEPEIKRTNLASVILQMHATGLGRVETFPFLDPPNRRYVRDGYHLLRELGALDADEKLTQLGKQLARLPVDPRIGRMIIAAQTLGCVREMLVIASALSVGDPRERPFGAMPKAEMAHGQLRDPRSDFMTFLKIWLLFQSARHRARELKILCKTHFLSYRRMVEWRDIHSQLTTIAKELDIRAQPTSASFANIHRALLTGLITYVGVHNRAREYRGIRDSRFILTKNSGVRFGRCIVTAEWVETSALFAHTAAKVRPEWIEQAAGELVQVHYFEPYWDVQRAEVMAYERITLFGLTIIPKRRIRFTPRDFAASRRLFITEALVAGRYTWRPDFREHNERILDQVRELEIRSRRTDIAAGEEALVRFFEKNLPEEVANLRGLKQWYENAAPAIRHRLRFSTQDICRAEAEPVDPRAFPDVLTIGPLSLPLHYRFAPGQEEDGLTVSLPLPLLPQLSAQVFDWLTPGFLRMKVEVLLRALPKNERRRVVPIPDTAKRFLRESSPRECFDTVFSAWLESRYHIAPESTKALVLPNYLRMRFEIVHRAQVLASNRDLHELRVNYRDHAEAEFNALARLAYEKRGITAWTFGEIPSSVALDIEGLAIDTYPGIQASDTSVSLRLFHSAEISRQVSHTGVHRLFMLQMTKELKELRRNLPNFNALCLQYLFVPQLVGKAPPDTSIHQPSSEIDSATKELRQSILALAVEKVMMHPAPERWSEYEFRHRSTTKAAEIRDACFSLCQLIGQVLEEFTHVRKLRATFNESQFTESLQDIDQQLTRLIYRGFLQYTPIDILSHLPRYLLALHRRLEKLPMRYPQDLLAMRLIKPLWEHWTEGQAHGISRHAVIDFRWKIEELRVSLFAQELGTRFTVSPERLEREWQVLEMNHR